MVKPFKSFVDNMSDEEIEFGHSYPYSKIFAYLTNLMSDKEVIEIEQRLAHNPLLRDKISETEFIIKQNKLDSIDNFKHYMKSEFHIDIN